MTFNYFTGCAKGVTFKIYSTKPRQNVKLISRRNDSNQEPQRNTKGNTTLVADKESIQTSQVSV